MRDQLLALAKLWTMDDAARRYESELVSLPLQIEEMGSALSSLRRLVELEKQQLTEAESVKRTRVTEIAERRDAVANAKSKSARSRNSREVDAAEREVEVNRRAITDREREISQLEEKLEHKRKAIEQREAQLAEAETLTATEIAGAEARASVVSGERDRATVGRQALVDKLPRGVMKRYDRLRQQERYNAVSIVSKPLCSSCNMTIPAQLFIHLQRAEGVNGPVDHYELDDFFTCPRCRAFLVYGEVVDGQPRLEVGQAVAQD